MTTLRPAPLLALSALCTPLAACGDDGRTSAETGDPTITTTPPPTTAVDTTAAAVTTTADTTGSDTGDPPDTTGATTGGTTTDLTTGTSDQPNTTGFPGEPGCSDDLHDVLDEQGGVLETCPNDQACHAGACIPVCDAVAQLSGTVGCDFWAPSPPFIITGPCYAVFVANAWNRPAQLTVTRAGQTLDVSAVGRLPRIEGDAVVYDPIPADGIPPDEVAILFLSHLPGAANGPYSLECPVAPGLPEATAVPGTGLGDAFHVTSDVPLSAYDINPYGGALSFLPSASLLFPATSWGRNHMSIGPDTTAFTLVVAREDDTIVKVAPPVDLPGGAGVAPAPAGVTTQYTLNAGQILQWSGTLDPSGAVFDSDKPIGLWTGGTYLHVQSQTLGPGGGEGAHQQIAPVEAMGNEYVGAGVVTRLASLAPESVPYRMVGAVDGTTLTYDPAPPPGAPTSLTPGQVAQFETTVPFTVRSQDPEHPFLFSQYMTGTGPTTRPGCTTPNMDCGLGDEEWVSLLSSKQFQSRYVFFTDPTYGTTNLVIVRAQASGVFADVTIACLGAVTNWQPVGAEGLYEVAHVDLERGGVPAGACGTSRHLAESDGPFGVVVWGTDTYSSYGYPAGSDIAKLNEVVLPVPG